MTRKCSNCGETVQSNSLTCPRCFKSVPREDFVTESTNKTVVEKEKNFKLFSFLTFVPSIFGFMGLGQIYFKEYKRGIFFLGAGLLLAFTIAFLLMGDKSGIAGFLTLYVIIGLFLLFILLYVIQVIDAYSLTLLKHFGGMRS